MLSVFSRFSVGPNSFWSPRLFTPGPSFNYRPPVFSQGRTIVSVVQTVLGPKKNSPPKFNGGSLVLGRRKMSQRSYSDHPEPHAYNSEAFFRPMTRINTFFNFVPQQQAWIIERFGKFHRVAESGFQIVIPFFEKIAYAHSLKETTIPVYPQPAITQDNVHVTLDGNVYIQVFDPMKASYGVENPIFAITQLAQTAMRSEIGKITLDRTFEEREVLNARIVTSIDSATQPWGIRCLRYEIKDIVPPQIIRDSMNKQADAERRRREMVLDSEGKRQYQINDAEGVKRAKELESEGYRTQQINHAQGDAQATLIRAKAQAEAISLLAQSISNTGGDAAMKMRLAEEFISQYGRLAEKSNTIIIPDDPNNIGNWVGKAMGIVNTINEIQKKT